MVEPNFPTAGRSIKIVETPTKSKINMLNAKVNSFKAINP